MKIEFNHSVICALLSFSIGSSAFGDQTSRLNEVGLQQDEGNLDQQDTSESALAQSDDFVSVCDRTEQIKQAITKELSKIGVVKSCDEMTTDDLHKIKHFQIGFDRTLVSLKSGDLSNLNSLKTLYLNCNPNLYDLPNDLLVGKANLRIIAIHTNPKLKVLPEDFFTPLLFMDSPAVVGLMRNGFEDVPRSFLHYATVSGKGRTIFQNPLKVESIEEINQAFETYYASINNPDEVGRKQKMALLATGPIGRSESTFNLKPNEGLGHNRPIKTKNCHLQAPSSGEEYEMRSFIVSPYNPQTLVTVADFTYKIWLDVRFFIFGLNIENSDGEGVYGLKVSADSANLETQILIADGRFAYLQCH